MELKWFIAKIMKFVFSPSALKNCQVDRMAKVGAKCDLTCVSVGKHSYVGHQSFFVNTSIGKFCSIGERCVVGGATHPTEYVSTSPAFINGLNGKKTQVCGSFFDQNTANSNRKRCVAGYRSLYKSGSDNTCWCCRRNEQCSNT